MLKVNEIFLSIQGESSFAGLPFAFVRLTGCDLRCTYCDTKYAYDEGELLSVDDIVKKVQDFGVPRVCVTGGEPMLQQDTPALLCKLCNIQFLVTLETNGHHSVADVDERVRIVLDMKTPGSGMCDRNRYENLNLMTLKDEVKFVVTDKEDYEWAKQIIVEYELAKRTQILLSPCQNTQKPMDLAEWMLEDKLNCRLQLQLHKIIWGNQRAK
ncbi:MAG: 7-carboxy-7-deazaguanine synthase QueE [Planctomycetes bacterium]|nr:7-carboxy-7-deazaguanine synthase QueE [Planctomycetota bacterium]